MASAGDAKRIQSARPSIRMRPGRARPSPPYHLLTISLSLPSPYHLLTPPKSSPWPSRHPPRPLVKPSFYRLFFQLDFCSPKYLQNGQKIAPKSTKNPVQIASESHARFCIHFYIGFYRFAVCLVSLLTFKITLPPAREHDFYRIDLPTSHAFSERKNHKNDIEKHSAIIKNPVQVTRKYRLKK